MNDFLEAVRQGRADALLTKDLTRLGRDAIQTAAWIADSNTSGVGVFSVIDLTL
ncbi:MAG: recombinase family protein [Firmicutes bacterium]|uniref:recombinase family protein n=1 Tax=Eubacterium callanderi TaxID=53442 RepID=UPI001D355024|nr:recombinase family protein [Bacillota bacterium]